MDRRMDGGPDNRWLHKHSWTEDQSGAKKYIFCQWGKTNLDFWQCSTVDYLLFVSLIFIHFKIYTMLTLGTILLAIESIAISHAAAGFGAAFAAF